MLKVADAMTPINTIRSLSDKSLAIGAGAAASAPFIPWGTIGALRDKYNGQASKDELGQSATTDAGRSIGAGLGAGAVRGLAENWHIPRTSSLANMALILGGMGVGGFLGQRQGKQVGQELFPGSFADRLHRSISQL
jgi:hypothetical protein